MPKLALASSAKLWPRAVPSAPSAPTYANISRLPTTIASSADRKPMPATRMEPVMAPVMIIGNPSHTIETEKVLRRFESGTGSCSYSSPSTVSSTCV
ncbi:hypothetical protein D9M72_589830 [compost metagenome]